jgi:hypothetical protein
MKTVHGNTTIGMPFIIDTWRDSKGSACVSVQLQLLSGNDMYTKVFARVSTDQKELIINLPMSQYMSCSDFAFRTFLVDEKPHLSASEKECLLLVLQHHPKTAARMQAVSKIRGRSNTDGFFYEQRITLPRACEHSFAMEIDGDKFFHGKKFVQYPDRAIFSTWNFFVLPKTATIRMKSKVPLSLVLLLLHLLLLHLSLLAVRWRKRT